MKKALALSLMLGCVLLLSCEADKTNEPPPKAKSDAPAPAPERKADVMWSTGVKSVVLDKILPFPDSWEDIAVVETPDEDELVLFRLYEKLAYEADGGGFVFAISAQTTEDFAALRAHFLETEGVEVYSSCFAQASYVLGEDEEYAYILALPTDVQYLTDDSASEESYASLQEESQVILSKFMEINGISANPMCPASDIYDPHVK